MRTLFRHIIIDISWFISWIAITGPVFVILYYSLLPITGIINHFDLLPFKVPHANPLFVLAVQVALTLLWSALPEVREFLADIRMGARKPSLRELDQIETAFEFLQSNADAKNIKLPHIVWRVIDNKDYNACAYGKNRIAIHKGALYETKFLDNGLEELAALMAHETGHLRYWDTRHAAISSAIFMPLNLYVSCMKLLMWVPVLNLLMALIVLPCSLIVYIGNKIPELTSRLAEYRADEFAQMLLGKECMSLVFESIDDERQGSSLMAHYLTSHPPTELRHNNLQLQSDYRPHFNNPPTPDLISRFRAWDRSSKKAKTRYSKAV